MGGINTERAVSLESVLEGLEALHGELTRAGVFPRPGVRRALISPEETSEDEELSGLGVFEARVSSAGSTPRVNFLARVVPAAEHFSPTSDPQTFREKEP